MRTRWSRLLLMGLLVALCTTAAAQHTLRVAYDADPDSLDPHEQLSGATLQLSHLLFDPLLRWKQDRSFEPRLAERWERIDPLTTRFHLRPGVKFHSGRLLTSQDVAWTFARLQGSPDFKGLFAPFKPVRVIDDHTFELITHQPYPLVLNLATYIFVLDRQFYQGQDEQGRNKEALVKSGDSFAARNVSGSGPFRLVSRQQGVRLELQRFANHWDRQSPGNVERIVLTPIKEDATRIAALLAGDVDFIAPVPPADLPRLQRQPAIEVVTMTGTRIITLQLNQQRVPAFADPRVRRAVRLAINNVGITEKLMRGFATPAAQLSPTGYPGHDPALVPRFDLAEARQLLQQAGHGQGLKVTMLAPNNRYVNDEQIAQAVVGMLAKIGIGVELKTVPKAQYWPLFDQSAADMLMLGWQSDTEDSGNFFEFMLMTHDSQNGYGQYNSGHYRNPALDALLLQAQTELDPARRAQLLQQAERLVHDDAAIIPLHWQNLAWAARRGVRIDRIVNVMDFPYLGDLVIE